MKIAKKAAAVLCASLLLLVSGVFPFSIPIVANAAETINLSNLKADYTISDSGEYIITGKTTEYRIIVASGSPTITLSDATIDFSGKTGDYSASDSFTPIDLNSATGMCNIILQGKNVLNASLKQAPGIKVGQKGVTFDGSGSLEVHGGEMWCGIGNSGTDFLVRINGGTIKAYGGKYAAGIGNSNFYTGCTIEINGGNIMAQGGGNGSGIGCGRAIDGNRSKALKITINGGTINAHGGDAAAGIGGGYGGGSGTITINDGLITAQKGNGDYNNTAHDVGSGCDGLGIEVVYNGGIVNGVAHRPVTVSYKVDPYYTVEIPASVNLSQGKETTGSISVTGCIY